MASSKKMRSFRLREEAYGAIVGRAIALGVSQAEVIERWALTLKGSHEAQCFQTEELKKTLENKEPGR